MRRIPLLLLLASSATFATAAAGDVHDTRVVARVGDGGHALLYQACRGAADDPSCSLGGASASLRMDTSGAAIDAAHAVFSAIPVGTRHVLHVKVPLVGASPDQRAWEAVLVPGPSPVVAAGLTGWARGEPGERSGVRVVELPAAEANGKPALVVGEIHEERRICGQTETLIQPRALDPATLALRGVTLPRLSEEARAGATPLTAEAIDPATLAAPLAPLLRAQSTSAEGSAAALTDGKTSTAWSEQRSGDGHGEFVTMASSPVLPIDRLAFTLLPTDPSAATAETRPHTVHLATGAHLYEVTFPAHGDAFVVKLPEPIATGCLSLVLDRAEGNGAHPVVTVAEIAGYGPFDGPGATADTVARALDDDARGDGAVQELARLGDTGVRAAGARLPALAVQGQRRALTVAESGSCEVAAPLFVFELGRPGVTPEAAARSERALRRCDEKAAPALLAALQAPASASPPASPASSVDIARVAAEVTPDGALPLLLHHVAVTAADAPGESGYRDALAHAAERASSAAVVKALSAEPAASTSSSPASGSQVLTLVRALGKRAAEIASLATPIAVRAGHDASAARRYLAVDPLVALAATVPEARATLASLEGDPAWTVRLRLVGAPTRSRSSWRGRRTRSTIPSRASGKLPSPRSRARSWRRRWSPPTPATARSGPSCASRRSTPWRRIAARARRTPTRRSPARPPRIRRWRSGPRRSTRWPCVAAPSRPSWCASCSTARISPPRCAPEPRAPRESSVYAIRPTT
jgi:hypothetical protein